MGASGPHCRFYLAPAEGVGGYLFEKHPFILPDMGMASRIR